MHAFRFALKITLHMESAGPSGCKSGTGIGIGTYNVSF